MAKEKVTDYKIEQHNNAWSYLYVTERGRGNIIASSVDELRQKVLTRDLPWNDKSVLTDVSKNNSNFNVRIEALRKINDESFLADIAKNDSDDTVRIEAVRKINDESFLEKKKKNDSFVGVRFEAIKKISDDSVLAYATNHDASLDVRLCAAKKINDENLINKIEKEIKKKRIEARKKTWHSIKGIENM